MASSPIQLPCAAQSVGTVNSLVSTLIQTILTAQCALSAKDEWPKDYADTALSEALGVYDFIVIGAGSAGSVVASRLSENPDWKVLVLEAGDDPPQESEIPILGITIQQTPQTFNYYSEPTTRICQGLKHRLCYNPRGKVIGGSGAINGMVYVQGHQKDFDDWLAAGNTAWGWKDVKRYYEKAVRPVGNDTHPKGYVVLNERSLDGQALVDSAIFNATAELGVPSLTKYKHGIEIGTVYLPVTARAGRRMSTGKVYLAKVSRRPNLHVIKNAHVRKIHFEHSGKRATKVTFVLRGLYELSVEVRKEVVLSAGAIDSAKLLLLSGVGPRKELEALHIPVVHDLAVGSTLCDHVHAMFFFKVTTKALDTLSYTKETDAIYDSLIHKGGIFTQVPSGVTSFIDTKGKSDLPDIQIHYTFHRRGSSKAFERDSIRRNAKITAFLSENLKDAHLLSFMLILAQPGSVGKIRLRSTKYLDPPRIHSNFLDDSEDIATFLRGIRFIERLERSKALRAINATLLHIPLAECDGYKYRSDSYWRCYIKYLGEGGYHHTCTVKMGPAKDREACVNPRLLLHGVENLRVADASIMPNVPRGNTQAPVIMIGERAADFIKEDWQKCDGDGDWEKI
ncbi:glucose dehydrogenase [FAD, quinone]-like [Ceratitis capitata]|uniref:glucose dehydrogenase [FAD, quinone]-like n=1 Tax=Ceratitis capitata TaxID=7213 RepID=UPI00061888E9|nr:glucose dehydrogenase [FAD, quinone]-like [Ceratitis capitata]